MLFDMVLRPSSLVLRHSSFGENTADAGELGRCTDRGDWYNGERAEVQAELVGIWGQPTKPEALLELAAFKAKYAGRYPEAVRSLAEDEEHLLTFYAFPATMHRHIQTTNAIESLFSNVRQRTDQIDVFTTETSCLAIVWATIQDIRLHKILV